MLTIDFLTDYVCPFCLVTKENLRAALKTLHQEAEIIEHPYALTPEGGEATDICDEEHRAYFARLKEPAETVGLNMQLPPEICPRPMTYLAFEGAVLAEKSGKHEAWSDRVYRAYWVEGCDIGQIDVLCALAAEIGLNADEMRQALDNRTYASDVKAAIQHTLDTYHPRGVPILFVDGQRIRLKAYTLAEMTDVLRGVIPADKDKQEETGCSADGCRLNW